MHASVFRAALGASATIAVLALPAASAADAPAHTETGDAGQTIATAQAIGGTGSLTSIQGAASSVGDADLYKICVNGTVPFSASVDGTTVIGPGGDPQLPDPPILTTRSAATPGLSSTASLPGGVLPNPMLSLVGADSKLFDFADDNGVAGGEYLPSQTASVENPVPPAGVYYLGISPNPTYPANSGDDQATTAGDSFAFFKTGTPADAENTGSYTMKLTGAEACPAAPRVATVDGPLTPFLSDGSSRFKFGTTLEIRVKPRDSSGQLVTGLKPKVNIVRTGNPSGTQTANVAFNSQKGTLGKEMRYSEQFAQYQFYASTKASQFNAGKDLTPGRYRLDVSDPSFPTPANKVSRNFAIVP